MEDWEQVMSEKNILASGTDSMGFLLEDALREDLAIIQPDGSRACVHYELRGNGFGLVDLSVDPYSIF